MVGIALRFDDTLETVLAADLATPYGVQSAWRQLVDLIGRRRVPADARAMATLRSIRDEVPAAIRAASARALEHANPPGPLVRMLALDDLAIGLPVLRSARLNSGEWIQLLPELTPPARSILRNRRDLSPIVKRALESFGPTDFVLSDETTPVAESPAFEPDLEPSAEPFAPEEEPTPSTLEEAVVAPEPIEAPAIPVEQGADASPVEIEVERAVHENAETMLESEPEDPMPVAERPVAVPIERATVYWRAAPAFGGLEDRSMKLWPATNGPPIDAESVEEAPVSEVDRSEPAVIAVEEVAGPEPVAAEAIEALPNEPDLVAPEPEVISEMPAPAPARVDQPDAVAEAAPDIDFSFVAFAETAGVAIVPAKFESDQHEDDPGPIQSGTVEAAPAPTSIAEAAAGAQEGGMDQGETIVADAPEAATEQPAETGEPVSLGDEGPFEIAEVVARIDAFWKHREEAGAPPPRAIVPAEDFRFETDSKGVVRWVDGVSRAPVIGLSLELHGSTEGSRVDGVAGGAFRRRAGFSNARLVIEGESDASGDWLISAIPVFDPSNGRFTGYRGTARRPRVHERAEPVRPEPARGAAADSLRQLVHELRTPTNAIAGFAEMIETQMLGPVSDPYRNRAHVIRGQAKELLGAIDDLDLAARIDSDALALVPGHVALRPLLSAVADDLAPLAELRGSMIALPVDDLAVAGDRRAIERLLTRLMATLVSASVAGERIGVRMGAEGEAKVALTIDRPNALADYPGESVLGIDDEREDATLLGTGFALRLARNLARELGGSLVIEPESLTLRLPAAVTDQVDRAHLN